MKQAQVYVGKCFAEGDDDGISGKTEHNVSTVGTNVKFFRLLPNSYLFLT